MPTFDWMTLRKLVEAARQVPSSHRLDFLKNECGDQPDLLAEALSLLQHEDRAENFLEPPAPTELAPLFRDHHAVSYIGKKIGPFEITGLLGYGGMGLVLRARQSNPPREVALKIVRGGSFVDQRQLRLFEREIHSLARLAHPAIASLYEAGCTEDGQHYFAMELVEGEPITVFADRKNLSISQRLSLFQQLSDAIHYAHQRGVIHRDLKPNNVLVTANENVKVLDFGLAKITDSDLTVTSIGVLGNKVEGTIAYMSPEQARGAIDEIDVRSDVYSLGIVLYELLTRRMPYNLGSHLPEIIRQVCHDPPIRPGSITRTLRGDLETIILKAIEKEPSRRYQSADALADEIQRFLNQEPISARPPSAVYQFRKFAARYKLPFTFAALLLAIVVGSAVTTSILAIHLARERDAAITAKRLEGQARQSAEEMTDFLIGLFRQGDPSASEKGEPTVRDVVEAGITRVRTELVNQPLVQARLMTTLGQVCLELGAFDRARELLEAGLAFREREPKALPEDLIKSMLALNQYFLQTGEGDRGYAFVKRALEIARRNFGESNAQFADVLEVAGENRFYSRDFETAADSFRRCLELRLKRYGEQNLKVASTLHNLGGVLESQKKFSEAEPLLQRAITIKRELHAPAVGIIMAMESLAHVQHSKQNYVEAERILEEEVEFARANLHQHHRLVRHSLSNYATVIMNNHGEEQADPLYREALGLARSAGANIVPHLRELAFVRKMLRDYDEAASLYAEALALRRARLGNLHHLIGETSRELGLVLAEGRRFDEAEPALLESFAVYFHTLGENHASTARAMQDLALFYEQWDHPDEASQWREKFTESVSP